MSLELESRHFTLHLETIYQTKLWRSCSRYPSRDSCSLNTQLVRL